jgi:hypothetical protein
MPKNPLIGSERQPLPGARVGSELLVVVLMRQVPLGLVSGGHFPDPFRPISKPSNSSQTGTAWPSSRSIRAVVLSGTVAQFNDAFGVDLQQFEHAGGSYRGRTGAIHTP